MDERDLAVVREIAAAAQQGGELGRAEALMYILGLAQALLVSYGAE